MGRLSGESKEIIPGAHLFFNTATEFPFVAAMSAFPSLSKSPIEAKNQVVKDAKLTLVSKEIFPFVVVFLITDNTDPLPCVIMIRSGFKSPSKSPVVMKYGCALVVKSTLELNEIFPGVLVFTKTEMVFVPSLATAISGFPSPFKSLRVAKKQAVEVEKSILGAKETFPILLVFLKTEKL